MTFRPSSLVLGTVQFGLSYGVANKAGQPDQARVTDIVRTAFEKGIREFDTAQDYGVSEEVLGVALARLGISAQVKVISKIDPVLDHCSPRAMVQALDASLEKLRVPSLFGLMLHQEGLLDKWHDGLGDILKGFVRSGKVGRLGVSVYSPSRALEALAMEGIDMVQIPSNILDRRFENQGVFELAEQKEKQVYVRSVFLQGLILMEPEDLPVPMAFARPVLERMGMLSRDLGLTRHELALGYVKERMPGAKLVIGVETARQVMDALASLEKQYALNLVALAREYFSSVDEKILNPSLWKRDV